MDTRSTDEFWEDTSICLLIGHLTCNRHRSNEISWTMQRIVDGGRYLFFSYDELPITLSVL